MAQERLQKIIAAAGIASRRHAEQLITEGRVTVNGAIVSTLGSKADPETDHIKVDGKAIHVSERHIYLMLHKPKGYVTTVSDPEGRPTVMELVRAKARVFPVGRLDWNTEGLLLLTNDGALTAKLTHASTHVPKTYLVKVAGQPTREDIQKLREGVMIGGEGDPVPGKLHRVRTAPAQVREVREADNPWYEVTLIEGRNRQIRRMFEAIGHHVEKIKRVRYGPLELDIPPGVQRELRPHEVAQLLRYVTEPAAALREQAALARAEAPVPPPRAAGLPPPRSFEKPKNFRFRRPGTGGEGPRREGPPRGGRAFAGGRREAGRPERFGARPPRRDDERDEGRRGGVARYGAEGELIPYVPPARPERPAFRGARPPRREFGDRPPRREFGGRPPRGGAGERPFQRAPRAEGGESRGPKRFGGSQRFSGGAKPFGAGPRREGAGGFGGPRRSGGGSRSGMAPKRFGGPKRFGAGPRDEATGRPGGPPRRFGGPKKFGARPAGGPGGPKRFGGPKKFDSRPAGGPGGPKRFGRPKKFGARPAGGPGGPRRFGGPKKFGSRPSGGPGGPKRFGGPKKFGGGPRREGREGGAKRFGGPPRRGKRDGR